MAFVPVSFVADDDAKFGIAITHIRLMQTSTANV